MLSVCPTPIGNLGDITLRVLETLAAADLVAAEDTRRARKLLSHLQISKPLVSFYEHNELRRLPRLIEKLRAGDRIALVSDAGMPGICDPGYRLVKAALDAGLPVEVLPGPSAIETALVSSGFATDSFTFLGYVPRKKGDREKTLEAVAAEPRTCIAFESPHRLKTTLRAADAVLGDRQIAVCREITKKFEEITRGSAAALAAGLPERVRGEIVLVFAGAGPGAGATAVSAPAAGTDVEQALRQMLAAGLPARQTADLAAALSGMPRNQAYQETLMIKKKM